ncbi:MAG: preprotein translocase subunit SecG [Elusimicrobiota bacterium]|jgi:preprotein translocase subunit SecG|nr:preprotein translocase subunit SecG [Elusimicrobiota bacterium]
METLYTFFRFVHYIVCAGLIIIILLQAGKSGGMAGIFGGGGADQIFSAPSGKAFIKKITIVMACTFLITSLFLTKLSSRISVSSVINQLPQAPISAPAPVQTEAEKI